jgi:hypothetical protein
MRGKKWLVAVSFQLSAKAKRPQLIVAGSALPAFLPGAFLRFPTKHRQAKLIMVLYIVIILNKAAGIKLTADSLL